MASYLHPAEATGSRASDELPTYDDEGVDRSLIRWLLSLTPAQRLEFLDSSTEMIASARRLEHESR